MEETVWFDSEAKAQQFLASVASSNVLEALYNPRSPNRSVLLNRPRVADGIGVVAGSTISSIMLYLVLLLWPAAVPELDFPIYQNAEVYDYPVDDDERKFWVLTSADTVDDVTAYYDAEVGDGWHATSSWNPGLPGSVYKVWVRTSTASRVKEEVTVRVQPEKTNVRKGLKVSIGYRIVPREQ